MSPVEAEPATTEVLVDPLHTHLLTELKHERRLTTLCCDPAGQYVAAGAEDLDVQLWKIDDEQPRTLQGHDSWVRSMQFSADSSRLYTACWGGVLKAWDLTQPEPTLIYSIQAHQGSARWVSVSPDGKSLATCGNDLLVKTWDAATGSLLQTFAGHKRHVYGVQFHPVVPHIVSQDLVGVVKIWNLSTGEEERTVVAEMMTGYDKKFAADMGGSRDLQFHPDGTRWASAGITKLTNGFAGDQDPIIVVFDWESAEPLRQLGAAKNFKGIAWGVRFHPQGFLVGAGAHKNGKGELWFYDAKQDEPFHTVQLPHAARGLGLLGDNRLAVAQTNGHVGIYQMSKADKEDA